MSENFANKYQTTLAAGVTSGALTGSVASVTGVPTVPFRAIISAEGANTDEIVLVTGRASSVLTWTRAAEAVAGVQVASAHGIGATFTAVVTAVGLANLGGGGLPSQWSDGGDGDVTATTDDPTKVPFTIQQPTGAGPNGQGTDVFAIIGEDLDPDANPGLFLVGADGGVTIFGRAGNNPQVYVQEGDLGEYISFGGQGIGLSTRAATTEPEAIWVSSLDTGERPTALMKDGTVRFSGAAPADAYVHNGICFMYFDSTNGAAKIKFKGKTANGTVVTGSLNLT
jgi:uncharacterized OB-fold protein